MWRLKRWCAIFLFASSILCSCAYASNDNNYDGFESNRCSGSQKWLQSFPKLEWTWSVEEVSSVHEEPGVWKYIGFGSDKRQRQVFLRLHFGCPISSGRQLQSVEDDMKAAQELSVSVAFEDIYKTIIFIAASWAMGKGSVAVGMPSLVGEIISGFLLGPPLANFAPFPEAMVLIGSFGLIGLLLESGIDFDVGQLKETGKRAVIMAFMGTMLPLLIGFGLGSTPAADQHDYRSALAIGAAFAPSSLGVSGNVLSAGRVLNTPTGQLIVASSVVDDVLGLILLSILEVFVKSDPKVIDFILPFLSSFGYLAVLGYSGITWMPRLIEQKIMSRCTTEKGKVLIGFNVMFLLLLIYIPVLNYSGASYLTGAFLAGLPFSQIPSVRASFGHNGRQQMNWLLRIFFAATIGFQVPVTKFSDPFVLKWGAKFIAAVLAKIPLGLYVPRFQTAIPDDFPFDPYWRDVTITSLALLCRGEFNFIIASFSLGAGLIDAKIYSSMVFAILLASIVSPLVLAKVIESYNIKSKEFFNGLHPVLHADDDASGGTDETNNTPTPAVPKCDGYRPLFLAIQSRTPIHWGLQEGFKRALEEAGLIIIDHRSWHTLSPDSVDITEIFGQDRKVRVPVHRRHRRPSTPQQGHDDKDSKTDDITQELALDGNDENIEDGIGVEEMIANRCEEIKQVLLGVLGSCTDEFVPVIQVSQLKPHIFDDSDGYCFHARSQEPPSPAGGTDPPPPPIEVPSDAGGESNRERKDSHVSFASDVFGDHNTHASELSAPEFHRRPSGIFDADAIGLDISPEGFVVAHCRGGYAAEFVCPSTNGEYMIEESNRHRRMSQDYGHHRSHGYGHRRSHSHG